MKTSHLLLSLLLTLSFFQCKDSDSEVTTTLCENDAITTLTLDYGDGITMEKCKSVDRLLDQRFSYLQF